MTEPLTPGTTVRVVLEGLLVDGEGDVPLRNPEDGTGYLWAREGYLGGTVEVVDPTEDLVKAFLKAEEDGFPVFGNGRSARAVAEIVYGLGWRPGAPE